MPPRMEVDTDRIVSRYAAGESEFAIAASLGVSRDVIRRRLAEAGVERRGIKAAYTERSKRFPPAALGSKRPDAVVRMRNRNPLAMPGIPEKRAQTIAATYRAKPTLTEEAFEGFLNSIGLRRGVDYDFQVPIGRYVADFVFADRMLIVELDGRGHRSRCNVDAVRDERLRELGYTVIRAEVDRRHSPGPAYRSVMDYLRSEYGHADAEVGG